MHFFIDYNTLPQQSASELKFGPSISSPNNSFVVSTQFNLTSSAKAFACQKGMMVVRKNSSDPSNLVNLFIKPSEPTKLEGLSVRYYIYRGVKLTSFFTNNNGVLLINQEDPTNTEFIASYWRDRNKLSTISLGTLTAPLPRNIGYGDNNLPLSNPANLNPSRPITDLFNGKAPAKAFRVTEGMLIGEFTSSSKISFEIQLETCLSTSTTLGSSANNSIAFHVGNLAGLQLKKRKELALTYIDPAAFFGMHNSINTKTYLGSSINPIVETKVSTALYTDLISKFSNRNRVYLDIKNEKGMSYNFYDNYRVSISDSNNIKLNGSTTPTEYVSAVWPILYIDSILSTSHDKKKLTFNLRVDNNSIPILYVPNREISHYRDNNRNHFFTNLIVSGSNWTSEITLYIPHAGDAAQNNLAYYIHVHYFFGDPVTNGLTRFWNNSYFDSAFCSIDLENLGDATIINDYVENSSPVFIKEDLLNDGTGNFSYVGESGAYWDANRVLFYCKKLHIGGTHDVDSGKKFLPTYLRKLSNNTLDNSSFRLGLRGNFYISCKKYQETSGDIKVLGLNSYHEYEREDASSYLRTVRKNKEDLLLLGLSSSELQRLKGVTGLSSEHPRYIYLDPDYTNFLVDENNMRYYRFIVKVQGLNTNGVAIVEPTISVIVYSRDKQFFHSTEFASHEGYSLGRTFAGQNIIEYRIYNDGDIIINDNIDLSLIRKSRVTGITETTAGIGDYTTDDDDSITNDSSDVQKIYYAYYDQASSVDVDTNTTFEDFGSYHVLMEFRRKRVTSNVAATTEQQFINLGYAKTWDFTEFNNDGVWAQYTYKHNNTDLIVTRGKVSSSGTIGNRNYKKISKRIFMVYIEDNQFNNAINNRFSWKNTVRSFARPDLFAVFLAALRRVDFDIISQGFAYPDASSHPSKYHVNGDAFDTNYKVDDDPGSTDAHDIEFITRINEYGVGVFRIGPNKDTIRRALNQTPDSNTGIRWLKGGKLHNGHLHTEKITIDK